MSDLTAAEKRAYVEERWERASVAHTRRDGFYVILGGTWRPDDWRNTEEDAWVAAYDFTLQREEEIRLLRQEMNRVSSRMFEHHREVQVFVITGNTGGIVDAVRAVCAYARMYQKQWAELATLRQGMKEGK